MSNIIKLRRSPRTVRIHTRERKTVIGQETGGVSGMADFPELTHRQPSGVEMEQDDGRMLEEAFQQGIKEGANETEIRLRSEYEEKLEQERNRVATILSAWSEQQDNYRNSLEQSVAKFAIAVAEMILKRELNIDKGIILAQVKEALKRVAGVERITLRVNPQDEDIVRAHRATLAEGTDSIREMVIEMDATIEPGGCILESDSGNVDARLLTQLKRIEEALFEGGT